MVDAVFAFLASRGMKPMQLCEAIYGRGADNTVRGPGQVYGVLRGHEIPQPKKVHLWKETVGLDLTEIVARLGGHPRALAKTKSKPPVVTTPVRAALAKYEKATGGEKTAPLAEVKRLPSRDLPANDTRPPPLFAMSISQDGSSNVTLNLMGVTSEEAVRCFQTLSLANLLKPKP